ncbi:unnamed protein product [Effrenium voratum]|nr:unnamed protein product [Effrenium voratum]
MGCTTFAVILSSCCSVIWLVGIIATFAVLYGSQAKPRRECYQSWGPQVYLHRGNLSFAQENTYESEVTGTAANGANPEFDIMVTSDDMAIIHHDDSLVRMTGVDKQVVDTPWSEIQSLTVLAEIDGYDYGSTTYLSNLETVVTGACTASPTVAMDFDVKSDAAAPKAVEALRASSCTAKMGSIFATGLPTTGRMLVNELHKAGMDNHVSVFLHPGSYAPLGLYFFLKTGIFHAAAGASMISLHKTVWDVEEDLIASYAELGYCTGIYGIKRSEMSQYPSASYYIIDEGPSFPDTPNGQYGGDGGTEIVTYDGDQSGFNGLLALAICSIPLFLLSLICCCISIRRCCKKTTAPQ